MTLTLIIAGLYALGAGIALGIPLGRVLEARRIRRVGYGELPPATHCGGSAPDVPFTREAR